MATSDFQLSDPTTDNPPYPRRWILLSLRLFMVMLVILTLVSGLLIGVPAYHQHIAVEEIERLGGRIRATDRCPGWLRERCGNALVRAFEDVIYVDLSFANATDTTLESLSCLTNLEELRIDHTQVTDAGMAHLSGFAKLRLLYLQNTRVSDSGLHNLTTLNNLEGLWLYDMQVSDAGLAHLSNLTGLQCLYLQNTQVTDSGLVHIQRFPKLYSLWLGDTAVTDAGCAELKRAMPTLLVYR